MRKIKYAPKMVCAKKSYVKKIMCTKSYAHKKVMRKKSYVQKKLWAKKVMRQLLVCEYFFNLQLLSLIVNSCGVWGVCWPLELATGFPIFFKCCNLSKKSTVFKFIFSTIFFIFFKMIQNGKKYQCHKQGFL